MSRTSRTSRLAVLSVATVFALAGCASATDPDAGTSTAPTSAPETSAPEPSASAEPSADTDASASAAPEESAAPVEGEIVGTGYTFSVPEGWADPGQDIAGTQIDTLAADLTDLQDGFADNVNVLLSPSGLIPEGGLEDAAVAELEAGGAQDVSAGEPGDIDGAEVPHVSATFVQDAGSYLIDQFYPSNDDQTYVVTFSFSADAPQERRDEVIDFVLSSWTWN